MLLSQGSAYAATIALVATLAIQVFTAITSTATAMPQALASGHFIARHGAIRVSRTGVLICGSGITLVALPPPSALPLLALAPIVVGLGYGAITPASSEVLARTARPRRMALVFSIKQTGAPNEVKG